MKLVRMLDHPPFYEGVRMFFNNMPEVDLKFQGAALALNVGFIRRQIVDTITLKLADVIVVPNAFGFPLAPGAEIFRIASPPAQGILELTIVSADNLLPKDTDWFGRGSSDPYVKIACGAYQFQSHTVPKTLSPEFEFSVSVPISDLQRQRVLVELFDEDYLSKDDFLGRISIPVYKLVKSEAAWTRPLLDERGERGSSGTVTARARWHPLSLEVRASHADRPGMVFTGIYAATKLPPVRAGSAGVSYWVAVRCCNMMEGSCQRQRETDRLPGVQADADATPDGSEISEMKAKLDILRRHNLSEADILRVLGVEDCEPPLAQQQMRALSRSDTGLAVELIKSSKNFASVEWNRSFEFPVSRAKSATLSFDLVCQSGGAAPRKLGTYECNMEQVAACPWCTSVRTVPVPGTSAILKLKLQISFFGVGPSGPEASGRFGGA